MTDEVYILVADDDKAIRTVLNQALSRLGYVVKSTGTASNLWQWIEDGIGDLVITDVVMPDENGLDLLPRIKADSSKSQNNSDERKKYAYDCCTSKRARCLRISSQAI